MQVSKIKLEHPLSNLVQRCQTLCVPGCCGVDAFDFSPIHIASYLTLWRGWPDDEDVQTLECQLADLKTEAGASGITIEQMNHTFTPRHIEAWVDEIRANLQEALDLLRQSEARRVRPAAR